MVFQTEIVPNVFTKKDDCIRCMMIVISNLININDGNNNHLANHCLSKKSIGL